jgi:hypothetical protein
LKGYNSIRGHIFSPSVRRQARESDCFQRNATFQSTRLAVRRWIGNRAALVGRALCTAARVGEQGSWGPGAHKIASLMGPPNRQDQGATRGGSLFSPGSWGQQIASVMGPRRLWRADPGRDDRKQSHGSFRRRRGTPSGGTHEPLKVVDHRNSRSTRRWSAGHWALWRARPVDSQ